MWAEPIAASERKATSVRGARRRILRMVEDHARRCAIRILGSLALAAWSIQPAMAGADARADGCAPSSRPWLSAGAPPGWLRAQLGVLRRSRAAADRLPRRALRTIPLQSVDAGAVRA